MSVTIGAVLKQEVARLWQACCEEHGVDPTAGFIVFDETHPTTLEYNRAVGDWLDYRRQVKERGE